MPAFPGTPRPPGVGQIHPGGEGAEANWVAPPRCSAVHGDAAGPAGGPRVGHPGAGQPQLPAGGSPGKGIVLPSGREFVSRQCTREGMAGASPHPGEALMAAHTLPSDGTPPIDLSDGAAGVQATGHPGSLGGVETNV